MDCALYNSTEASTPVLFTSKLSSLKFRYEFMSEYAVPCVINASVLWTTKA